MTHAVRVPILAALGLLAACGIVEPESWDDRLLDLEQARALWAGTGLDSYRYDYFQGCFCAAPVGDFVVTVTDGAVTAAVTDPGGEAVPEATLADLHTMEELFDVVATAIEREVDGFRVDYDPGYGFPTLIDLDPYRHAIDDELRIEAGDLVALP
ncbi:MAG: DUF6174 domain-containing protein [Candidatus Longimicrobiales bacterium M2_2A_002]